MVTIQSALLADVIRVWVGAMLLRTLIRAHGEPDIDAAMFAYYQARCAQLLGPDQYA